MGSIPTPGTKRNQLVTRISQRARGAESWRDIIPLCVVWGGMADLTKRIARAVWTTFALAITFVGVTGSGHPRVASRQPQQRTSTPREAPVQSVKSKSDLRARTDDEKARAIFFDRYGAYPLEPGDSRVIFPGIPPPPIPPGAPGPTFDRLLEHLACSTQLVVLGRAEQRAVHLNQRETYLFTDYDVHVERWLRPEHGAPSLTGRVDGGRVPIAGRPTIAGLRTLYIRPGDSSSSSSTFRAAVRSHLWAGLWRTVIDGPPLSAICLSPRKSQTRPSSSIRSLATSPESDVAARPAGERVARATSPRGSMPDGSRLLMLRDPWGMPLQLCKRPAPLLPEA